jgi:hypothetical protein
MAERSPYRAAPIDGRVEVDTAAVIVIVLMFVGLMVPMSFAGLFANHEANKPVDVDEEVSCPGGCI